LIPLAYPPEHNDNLKAEWMANKAEIRTLLTNLILDLPHFVDLDWRLDIQLASRSARNILNPLFVIHLKTTKGSGEDAKGESVHALQADFSNLKHLTTELETALETMKQVYATRVSRNVNI